MSDDEFKIYNTICDKRFEGVEKKLDQLRSKFIAGLTGLVAILAVVVVDLVTHLPS